MTTWHPYNSTSRYGDESDGVAPSPPPSGGLRLGAALATGLAVAVVAIILVISMVAVLVHTLQSSGGPSAGTTTTTTEDHAQTSTDLDEDWLQLAATQRDLATTTTPSRHCSA